MGVELKEEEESVSGLADPSSSESQTSGSPLAPPLYVGAEPRLMPPLACRRDRALGAPAGSGPQQGDASQAEPAAVAAAELGPEPGLDLDGRDGGGAGAAVEAGPQHRHPDHRAAHQEAQGAADTPLPLQMMLNLDSASEIMCSQSSISRSFFVEHFLHL